MQITRSLSNKDHSIRLVVTDDARGWHLRQQEDSQTVSDVVYSDWHRVERALSLFDRKAVALRHQGWNDDGATTHWHDRDAA